MEAIFSAPQTDKERDAWQAITEFKSGRTREIEQELFELRKRPAEAERKLADKPTKRAVESKRIALTKIEQRMAWLSDLRRDTRSEEQDSRIYPGWYAPVLVIEDGGRVLKPMRYQVPSGPQAGLLRHEIPGTCNARRDNLEVASGRISSGTATA